MSNPLHPFMNKRVIVLSTDGRTFVGNLLSCDQSTNLVLTSCIERFILPADDAEGSREEKVGVQICRGDMVAVCGLLDEELDKSINWSAVIAEEIGGTKHV